MSKSDSSPKPRLVSPEKTQADGDVDLTLRPRRISDFVGQARAREYLEIMVGAARQRGEAVDHMLIHGPPGLGKTTMAMILAAEMGSNIRVTSGPALQRPGDLASILLDLNDADILFIDEIHRLPRPVEESLYPALEDYRFDILLGKGPTARAMRLALKKFTLVGATTRAGMVSGPLRDRFGLSIRLDFYSADEIQKILVRSAKVLQVSMEEDAAKIIAARSRGTPRVANKLLRRIRDYAQVRGGGHVDVGMAEKALEHLQIDAEGLDEMDRKILQTVIENFGGGPVGIEALAASLGEDSGTLEDMYEPHLVQNGFLVRSPQGRKAGDKAFIHLGLTPFPREQKLL